AVEKFCVDVLILDDGFQHRALHRDLDIVMIHGGASLSSMRLLPLGLLREQLVSLERANLIALSYAAGSVVRAEEIKHYTKAPVVKVHHKPKKLLPLDGNHTM